MKALEEEIKGIEGAMVEDQTFCICVHYQCIKEEVNTFLNLKLLFFINYQTGPTKAKANYIYMLMHKVVFFFQCS